MKKYIYNISLLLVTALALVGCKEEAGTEPGNDSHPVATLFKQTAQAPLNPDNDALIRIGTNAAVESVYYLAEESEVYKKNLASMGAEGYNEHVVKNGKKVENLGASSTADITVTNLQGEYTITTVAVHGGVKQATTTSFFGLIWADVVSGKFQVSVKDGNLSLAKYGLGEYPGATLQKCTNKEGLYRIKDAYGAGNHLKMTVSGAQQENENGKFYYVRITAQPTGVVHSKLGMFNVRDVAEWQNNEQYATSMMYENGYCDLFNQYFVSAGNAGYGNDLFTPGN